MRPVIPCNTVEVLRWFLGKCQVSVVYAIGQSWESEFPRDVQRAAADVSATVEFAAAPAAIIASAGGAPVSFGECIVFAETEYVGRLSDSFSGSDLELLGAVLAAFHDEMHEQRQVARRREILRGLIKKALVRAGCREAFDGESPHEVLGIHLGASLGEARRARMARLNEYHPDRVMHLGPAIRDLAESQSRKINWAFDEIKTAAAHTNGPTPPTGAAPARAPRANSDPATTSLHLVVPRKRRGGRRLQSVRQLALRLVGSDPPT